MNYWSVKFNIGKQFSVGKFFYRDRISCSFDCYRCACRLLSLFNSFVEGFIFDEQIHYFMKR